MIGNTTRGTLPPAEQGYSQKNGFVQTVYCKAQTIALQTLIMFHDTENEYKVYKRSKNKHDWSGWIEMTAGGSTPPTITKPTVKTWFKEFIKEMFDEWKSKHQLP